VRFAEETSNDPTGIALLTVVAGNLAWLLQRPLWIGRSYLVRCSTDRRPRLKRRLRDEAAARSAARELVEAVERHGTAAST
jgi:hypothetical protein